MSRADVVIPARDEPNIEPLLNVIRGFDCQPIVVVDHRHDATIDHCEGAFLINQYGAGPAGAIATGIAWSHAPVVVIMCADLSDNPGNLPDLIEAIEGGATVCAADRYLRHGERIGGPKIKHALSWLAGYCLGVDGTNLYKAYDGDWLRAQTIESRHGFTIGLELIAKARQQDRRILRVPTVWTDRTAGRSHWRWSWLPAYARWWAAAMTAHRSSSRPAPDTSSTSTAAPKA